MEQLAKNLYALRKERGLSREAVARELRISAKTYERYEKDGRDPAAPVLVQLADFFGVTLDQPAGRAPLPQESPQSGPHT